MKLLMFNTREFWFRTFNNTLPTGVNEENREKTLENTLVIFIHTEREDEEKKERVIRKATENIVWLAKKTGRTRIVLHSFVHLSDSRSGMDTAREIYLAIQQTLTNQGLDTTVTPFGCLHEFRIDVLGDSLAKVWKSI